jgi:hypothetical protein
MSLTIQAWVLGVAVWGVNQWGLPFTEAELSTTITVILGILSAIGVWYGRYRAGDINFWGKKI